MRAGEMLSKTRILYQISVRSGTEITETPCKSVKFTNKLIVLSNRVRCDIHAHICNTMLRNFEVYDIM